MAWVFGAGRLKLSCLRTRVLTLTQCEGRKPEDVMFYIGDFARVGRVSVRMLHHYDAIGLLSPDHVDSTGYRLYEATALARHVAAAPRGAGGSACR
ncbi:MerR family DNA-binding transcriptional regulator [Arthrobacter alpinus]|uniref:MerR family DNA-binding transcriptional regulator n=1 Tax=Arthrobacter alpinus TaxID=656366 RepID=UPI00313952A0